MAILFPIYLDGKRFFVNPTKIDVEKRSDISETRTLGGTIFQVYPDLPDEVSFEGMCFGVRSLLELKNLGDTFDSKTPESKEIELIYKFRKYRGYMRNLSVGAEAESPRVFHYKFRFISKDLRFSLSDMALGQMTGLKAEYDFLEGQIRGASTAIAEIPADALANVLNTANSIGRIGMNIGRPKLPSISSFRP